MLVQHTNFKKKCLKVFTSKFVGTGPSSYKKRIYLPAVSQKLRNTGIDHPPYTPDSAPSHFHFSPTLKEFFGGRRSKNNEKVKNGGGGLRRRPTKTSSHAVTSA